MYVFLLGKAAGFILGFIYGSLPGALLGLFLGHLVDRSLARNMSVSWQSYSGARTENRRQVFFAATFRVMGYIAKADGRVSEEEIRAARQVMQGMRLNAAQMRQAMDYFNAGKSPGFDFDAELGRINAACRGQPLLRQFFVHTQFFMAFAHGDVTSGGAGGAQPDWGSARTVVVAYQPDGGAGANALRFCAGERARRACAAATAG